ncbi:MAG: DUF697 domain-containing protein [Candidatus Electrothrix aestuarii]|uniref:DUF697 domain-containing protein n=1 Tax=Candidatus Electrothrix aestuarii TaxID=3062594 RepID=A0AAU8LZ08_9BACT
MSLNNLPDKTDSVERAEIVIRNHVILSMGFGLIPIPLLDTVGLTGTQLAMLRKLAKIYHIPFSEHIGKSALMSLIGGTGSVPVAGIVFTAMKALPIIGTSIAAITMPVTAGAITHATGRIFHQHFASGGTFLTFDPKKVQAYYYQEFSSFKEHHVQSDY